MNLLIVTHVAAGSVALISGALALAFRKGQHRHVLAGRVFVGAMLAMGVTAAFLGPLKLIPDRGTMIGGLFVCYLVATASWTMRQKPSRAGAFELVAALVAFGCAAAFGWLGLEGLHSPTGRVDGYSPAVPLSNGALALFAGLLDLNFLVRRTLTGPQRLTRHLWRMCVAMFMATGAFFLGQQDEMPVALRGSPVLVVLALFPFVFLVFWLFRVRLAGAYSALARWVASLFDRIAFRRRATPNA